MDLFFVDLKISNPAEPTLQVKGMTLCSCVLEKPQAQKGAVAAWLVHSWHASAVILQQQCLKSCV